MVKLNETRAHKFCSVIEKNLIIKLLRRIFQKKFQPDWLIKSVNNYKQMNNDILSKLIGSLAIHLFIQIREYEY